MWCDAPLDSLPLADADRNGEASLEQSFTCQHPRLNQSESKYFCLSVLYGKKNAFT